MRYTEYHDGVAVIKDKNLLKEAMEKLAKYEDKEDKGKALMADLENRSREDVIGSLHDYCGNRNKQFFYRGTSNQSMEQEGE